jgi:hypothetical protein
VQFWRSTGGSAANPPAGNAPTQPMPSEPDQPTQSSKKSFKPPLTANGNRLFACEKLDGDDCGRGDAKGDRTVVLREAGFHPRRRHQHRQQEGEGGNDGQFCSDKKCRVFDKIVCKM